MRTEAELIKACGQNSALAQQLLYTQYAPVLKGVCMRYIKNKEEAKDVLHDSFIKIFSLIHKYKGTGSFEGWLKRIVINVSIDHIKKNQKLNLSQRDDLENLEKTELTYNPSDSELLLNSGFTTENLLLLMHNVQIEYSTVFNMFYIDHLSHKDIAVTLQIDENTSRTRLFRARGLIRKELEKELIRRQNTQMNQHDGR